MYKGNEDFKDCAEMVNNIMSIVLLPSVIHIIVVTLFFKNRKPKDVVTHLSGLGRNGVGSHSHVPAHT